MKQCFTCKEEKDLNLFHIDRKKKDQRNPTCKECRRTKQLSAYYVKQGFTIEEAKIKVESSRRNRFDDPRPKKIRDKDLKMKSVYGIGIAEYETLLKSQDGQCAICKNYPNPKKSLCIDHDHKSGVVRGLLCDKCNFALGLFNDDLTNLDQAKEYLKKHKSDILLT